MEPDPPPLSPRPATVLSYATPGDRPEQGLFTVEQHPDGLTLTRPLRATPGLVLGLLLTTFLFGAAACGFGLTAFAAEDGGRPTRPVAVLCLVAFAAASLGTVSQFPATLPRLVTFDLRGGDLTMRKSPYRPWGVRWTIRGAVDVRAKRCLPSLMGGNRADLRVSTGTGRGRLVLGDLPAAEAEWAARQLNAALSTPAV